MVEVTDAIARTERRQREIEKLTGKTHGKDYDALVREHQENHKQLGRLYLERDKAARPEIYAQASAEAALASPAEVVGTPAPETHSRGYQDRVAEAHHALFHDDPTDIAERNARCFEEAAETAQAFGMTRDEAIALVDYTFSRPVGDPAKEIGAKVLTAFSLGVVAGVDVMAAAEADLEKLQRPETIARIRAKRSTRHGRGPLPGFDPALQKKGAME